MPQVCSRGRKAGHTALTRIALGVALGAFFVCANIGAVRAGDDDDTQSSVYNKLMHTFGLKPGLGGGDIDYSERSPLVVPPTRTLPPPAPSGAPAVANWPKDPDMRRRAEHRDDDKVVRPVPNHVVEDSRPLRPSELNVPGFPIGGSKPTSSSGSAADQPIQQPNKNLFSFDFFKKEEYATFTGEPARGSLTDPPPGYLTPSADQPYGVGPEKKQYKVQTVGDRMETVTGTAK